MQETERYIKQRHDRVQLIRCLRKGGHFVYPNVCVDKMEPKLVAFLLS